MERLFNYRKTEDDLQEWHFFYKLDEKYACFECKANTKLHYFVALNRGARSHCFEQVALCPNCADKRARELVHEGFVGKIEKFCIKFYREER